MKQTLLYIYCLLGLIHKPLDDAPSLSCYTRLLYICHGIFLWSIFKILSYKNCINESKLLLLMLNRNKQSYAFGSFKLLLRIINRYQPTERTDCELLQKSLLDKLKKEKKPVTWLKLCNHWNMNQEAVIITERWCVLRSNCSRVARLRQGFPRGYLPREVRIRAQQ